MKTKMQIIQAKVPLIFKKMAQTMQERAGKMADGTNSILLKIQFRYLVSLLLLFCFCWTALLVRVVRKSFTHPDAMISVTDIRVPGHIPFLSPAKPDSASRQAIQRIARFSQELDSIRARDYPKYRMLLLTRPGLVDSIHFIEETYLSIKK